MFKNLHKTVVVPDDVNIFFIGDIHGEHDMMMDALRLAGYTEKDYVFGVGDLIDRGPQNLQVLATFLYNPRFHSVRGNHDEFMISGDVANWMYNGGMWALNELDTDTIQTLAIDLDNTFPYFMTVEHRGNRYGIVHAGIPFKYKEKGNEVCTPNWNVLTSPENLEELRRYAELGAYLWDRDVIQEITFGMVKDGKDRGHPYFERYAGFKEELRVNVPGVVGVDYVFHGHTSVPFPFKHENRVYLDTGGTFNKRMTVCTPDQTGMLVAVTTDPNDPCGVVEVL